jgi:SagB-type dehydrogenase family enzyme
MRIISRLMPAVCILLPIFLAATTTAQAQEIKLPLPSASGKISVETALLAVKSVRDFSLAPISPTQVSQILWSANGNLPTDAVSGATYKVIPSAGGRYPLEVFLVTGKDTVPGIVAGVYLYKPETNSLLLTVEGDNRGPLAQACLSQMWLERAPAMVVIAAAFSRMTAKYGNRGTQYVFMEGGNSNQNVYLQCAALGLHTATVGAFNDSQVASVLKLPSGLTPLLVMAVGK